MARKPADFPVVEYFGTSSGLTPGSSERYTREQDNPLSEAFVPLEDRDDMAQARFWVRLMQRKGRAPQSELDEPGMVEP